MTKLQAWRTHYQSTSEIYWREFLQLSLGVNSCTIKKLGPVFRKISGNWGKDWVSFWQVAVKLEKNVGSVFD